MNFKFSVPVSLFSYLLSFSSSICYGQSLPSDRLNNEIFQSDGRSHQSTGIDVSGYAVRLIGIPYRRGGSSPTAGFDCSGLISYVFSKQVGITTPRTVLKLSSWGTPVGIDAARPGDLVIFWKGGVAKHAGIYIGTGQFIHAPSTGKKVRVGLLASKYWARQKLSIRRFVGDSGDQINLYP